MYRVTLVSLLLISTSLFGQEIIMPAIFNDHMVLQRNEDVRIWGWAPARSQVTIQIDDQQPVTATASFNGKWETYLPHQRPGGPHTITVNGASNHTFEDVYFGDVWIAGGQSNMEWKLRQEVIGWEDEVANSDIPEIRFLEIPNTYSPVPIQGLPDIEWKIANPENSPDFSAIAWFFAKLNHNEKNVPVGIIDSNWGGTPAESWTPADRLLTVEGYEERAAEVLRSDINWEERIEENEKLNEEKYHRVFDQTEFTEIYNAHETDFDDSDWIEIELPNEQALEGFVWLRKTFPIDDVGNARLSFGNPGKFTVVFINGEKVYTKTWSEDPEIIDIDANILREGENVIAIRTVEDRRNRTFIGSENELWIETDNQKTDLSGEWKFSNTLEPPMPEVKRYNHVPGFLYNAMIHPIAGYSIKGAIWYQGESNVGEAQYYNELFEAMIEEWREDWNQGEFPFLFVQLANFLERQDEPVESGWARLREAQTNTLSLANTGMATIIDIGEADDIHPRNKEDVGIRLWLAAKKFAFEDFLVYSGPMYAGHTENGNKVEVSFDHVGFGLINQNDGDLKGFAIAGSDRKFHWANARIEGSKVIVSSPDVDHPVAVRYGWADNPDVSLYNNDGLPAVPFRTDDW